jgi:hypothetical protein
MGDPRVAPAVSSVLDGLLQRELRLDAVAAAGGDEGARARRRAACAASRAVL